MSAHHCWQFLFWQQNCLSWCHSLGLTSMDAFCLLLALQLAMVDDGWLPCMHCMFTCIIDGAALILGCLVLVDSDSADRDSINGMLTATQCLWRANRHVVLATGCRTKHSSFWIEKFLSNEQARFHHYRDERQLEPHQALPFSRYGTLNTQRSMTMVDEIVVA